MGNYRRKVGEKLNLNLSIFPENNDLYVRATLYEEDGTFIKHVPLPSVGNGSYSENSEVMTSLDIIRVRYNVFYDALFLHINCEHGGSDDFKKDELLPGQLPDTPSLTATVSEKSRMEALFKDEKLIASVEESQMIAKLIPGEVLESSIESAEIETNSDSDKLTTNLGCKE